MKKRFLLILLLMTAFCSVASAQGKTELQVLGRSKGMVSSIKANGHTLVDAQATAKKLGGTVELFSASKQIKIAFPGMYAILSAPLREAIINASTVSLPTEVVASGGKMYVPVEFFLLAQVQQALNRQLVFEKNKLIVEKHYTVAFEEQTQQADYLALKLWTKGKADFTVNQINKHRLKVIFSNAVLKREVNHRLKDPFVRSYTLFQRADKVELDVILGAQGLTWKTNENANTFWLVLSAKPVAGPAAENAQKTLSVAQEDELTDDGLADLEELDLNASDDLQPSITEDVADEPEIAAASVPVIKSAATPVMSAAPVPVITAHPKMRIVVDPGHGGKDPGAVRRGSAREKDLNLAVSKHLYNYLKKQGLEVKMTRSDDTFVTLAGRSKMANEFKADLFVSVHTNATKRSAANGFEVYFRSDKATDEEAAEIAAFENESLQYEETHYNFVDRLLQSLAKNEYMNESSKLAAHVRKYVYKEPGIGIAVSQNSSIKQANFYVLRGVQAPAILVEMGFISSPKDRARLNNKSAQKKMGEGIAKGVLAYLKAEGKVK